MPDQNPAARIAIRFGASSNPSSALGKRHRPTFDDDADSDSNESDDAQHESITHFGAHGAENAKDTRKTKHPTPTDPNPDASRENHRAGPENVDTQESEQPLQYGLTLSSKPKATQAPQPTNPDEDQAASQPKTADEEAMDALMGKDPAKPRLLHRTEDDAYRDATASAPEVDDLATYDAIPVEGFGASLLKGQGWDGKMRGPKSKEIKKRPNGMGLGAKKLKADEDLGGWDSKGKTERRPRLDDYRRESDRERSRRDDRHRDSYKNERDRERNRDSHRHRDRDRDRDSSRRHDRDSRR